jgi:hypothetical protein
MGSSGLEDGSSKHLSDVGRCLTTGTALCLMSQVRSLGRYLELVRCQWQKGLYLLTYSMEQSPSWEANLQLVKKFPPFLEPEGSSPHPQAHATRPYPEPTPSPHNSLPLPEDPS